MLPAWVTKLRDVKAGSRAQKQQKKPLPSPSPSGKRRDEDPASFAKALSLQRAKSRARNSRFEAEIGHACKELDPLPSRHYDVKSTIDTFDGSKLRSYGDAELREEADSLISQRRDLGPWGCDSSSLSSCGIEPDPLSVKDIRFSAPSVQRGHGVSDNDTEDFALTPDTPDSSFCSETSSADSAVSCEEEGHQHQHQQPWKERNSPNVARNPSITCSKLQGSSSSCSSAASGNASRISTSKWQKRSIQLDAAENSSLLLSTKWQESVSIAAGNPGLISGLCPEKNSSAESPSLMSSTWQGRSSLSSAENSSLISSGWEARSRAASLMARGRKQRSNDAAEHATFISSKWQERTSNPPETPSSMPSRWEDRIGSDGAENPNSSCCKWQEKSNLNAAENPSLTSSKWQPSSSSSLAEPSLVWRIWQEGSSSSCAENSSLMCTKWQESSNVGSPNSKHEPSLRRRRRHSRSSISAVLPDDLQGVVGDSIALVKMSHNPCEDFRQSMYEMIMEKDLEESINVEELLSCYLTLNSPEHHELIEEVFSDVWSAILMTLR